MVAANSAVQSWKTTPGFWIGLACLIGLLILTFFEEIEMLIGTWISSEEYSHGILIPFITAFLIWQKKNEIAEIPFTGSWAGVVVVVLGLALYFIGELATLYIVIQYAFLIVLCGLVLAVAGRRVFKEVWVALFLLAFAIPLPNFLYQGLSTKLQLISSQLGVSLIRLCDISVYLEGNVIDLGAYKLQVVEACSGLRYLFPLMSLAFICAVFFKAAFWKRAVVFLSSLPITVFMNSLRVGVIGILVEYWGTSMAEGFLHDFEGWILFVACTGILIGEIWLLARIGKDKRPLREVFGVTFPAPLPAGRSLRERTLPREFWVVGGVLVVAAGLALSLEKREELVPPRQTFAEFPMRMDAWQGRREIMEQQYIDVLKFDDYILANFAKDGTPAVNFYSAYYASQRKGESVHSPRSCIPGGGWQIKSLEMVSVPGIRLYGDELRVNRVLIHKGTDRQLVYYWFQQRGRNMTNEYLVKWYLFWDALTLNRSDGALVRLTTYVPEGEKLAEAEDRLVSFLALLIPRLDRYIAN
ncbi:VPLPA-CTERM-specific exosortase XrtD [Methylocaldum sp.]|uniref:VPLPA-CTERM-specific exosortase XrtD n=1 Tax=Methylocaldum sp. TaxID=1969727 RepID=UPI002D56C552|nr:VPLPA-CTERM-specific exosortase XrtD [Methylocaldum sp.]HYE37384.1 VPLPA-CTERM-specific exosortase XrtD [Methylocaldum sp.]